MLLRVRWLLCAVVVVFALLMGLNWGVPFGPGPVGALLVVLALAVAAEAP